jgi:acetoin utilization protein AcuC
MTGAMGPGRVRVVWDDTFAAYDFGPGHPMAPVRLELTAALCRDLGLFDLPQVAVVGAEPATDDILHSVHSAEFVSAVRAAGKGELDSQAARPFGLGTDDVPIFDNMHEASARVVTGTRDLALAVWNGEIDHGVNFTGGLHHAMHAQASGFCVYNDLAAAIQSLLDVGVDRVAYVDVDVHHGDGVERIFWDDPRVMTVSVHESGHTLFPGTGHAYDVGVGRAAGNAVNLALPAGTADSAWLRAFHAIVPPLVRSFRPQVLITQHGCDSHMSDPLAHLALSLDCQRASYQVLHELAHELCDGRWVATGGGGYEVVDVVPRAWAHLVGIAAHHEIDPRTPLPPGWREMVAQRMRQTAPLTMSDGFEVTYRPWADGHDTGDVVDRAVMATRRATFPLHGLDPWYD